METVYRITGMIVVYFAALVAAGLILLKLVYVGYDFFKQTWAFDLVRDIRVWYKYQYKKMPMTGCPWTLLRLKNDQRLNAIPKFLSRRTFTLIEKRLQELRQEIINHGEQPTF